jgi:hypothetical protein
VLVWALTTPLAAAPGFGLEVGGLLLVAFGVADGSDVAAEVEGLGACP